MEQKAVAVDPPLFGVFDIVINDKNIGFRNQLEVANIGEEIRLHDRHLHEACIGWALIKNHVERYSVGGLIVKFDFVMSLGLGQFLGTSGTDGFIVAYKFDLRSDLLDIGFRRTALW
jgi:hypothetical protein